MSKAFFLSLGDWRTISDELNEQIELQRTAALGPPVGPDVGLALAEKEYRRGWYEALAYVLDLPNSILKDGNHESDKEADQKANQEEVVEGVRVVPAQPTRRPSRVF